MENATKALTMAGGVLIAIMVIATLVYASSTFQVIPKTQDESEKVRQLSLFNQQYESYAKGVLYGTDLVTLLNKAIDNNIKYSANSKEEMYIDIKFTLLNNVNTTNITYKKYYSGKKKGQTVQLEGSVPTENPILRARKNINNPYSLSGDYAIIKDFVDRIADSKEEKNSSKKQPTYGSDEGGKYRTYTIEVPDTSEFKLRIFACRQCEYDEQGRISYMLFEEINQEETT